MGQRLELQETGKGKGSEVKRAQRGFEVQSEKGSRMGGEGGVKRRYRGGADMKSSEAGDGIDQRRRKLL